MHRHCCSFGIVIKLDVAATRPEDMFIEPVLPWQFRQQEARACPFSSHDRRDKPSGPTQIGMKDEVEGPPRVATRSHV